jgi:competence protein ComEC
VADTDFPDLSHDDTVVVTGRLDRPTSSGPFDYAEHLLARGIGSILSPASVIAITPSTGASAMARVHQTRARLADAIERHVPEPQAAVASALSLGVRGGITPETNAAFRDSGLTHLLAVSGLHVGVLLATVLGLAARLIGRHRVVYLLPPLAVLWLYILLTGAPPSAVRAVLMGTAYLLALATGRASVPINALGLTALLVLAIDPGTAWDRSFQLSAAAMAGVLFIGLPLAKRAYAVDPQRPVWLRAVGQFLLAPAAISLGAVIGSTPLVAFNFGQIPLLSIPATLLAMPLVPPSSSPASSPVPSVWCSRRWRPALACSPPSSAPCSSPSPSSPQAFRAPPSKWLSTFAGSGPPTPSWPPSPL